MTNERSPQPLHGMELYLSRLWGALLVRDDISLTDNFFEIGGTALLAKELCRQLRQAFGCEVSVRELRQAPTIGALSLIIRTNGSGLRDGSLIPLQMGTSTHRCPIYCFHPISGAAGRYTVLMDFLDRDQPIFGLQAAGLTGKAGPDYRVDLMADRYSAAIRQQHTGTGAIFLGFSFGGLLAVETARRLSGSIVNRAIGVIDCSPLENVPVDDTYGYRTLIKYVLQLDADINSLMLLEKSERLTEIRAIASRQGQLPPKFSIERLERMVDVCHSNLAAADAYEPTPCGGSLTVFESDDGAVQGCSKQWESCFEKVTTYALPGDHGSAMEGDNLAVIMHWVKREITRLNDEADF